MSSTADISSSNDVTSTNNNSFPSVCLTTDAIIKECIKQGFYRNPICNEKLYLHNKGFDSIAPGAFEPYTDVKVLWLEGNGLSVLPCGAQYIEVLPPKRYDPFADSSDDNSDGQSEEMKEERTANAKGPTARHIDPTSGLVDGVTASEGAVAHPVKGKRVKAKGLDRHGEPVLPEPASIPLVRRDVFSSLYPTVRQLYLHNNLFREMPDISRFHRLDAINLSNNFFSSVQPHCAHWEAKMLEYTENSRLASTLSKSDQREWLNPTETRANVANNETRVRHNTPIDVATTAVNDGLGSIKAFSPQEARRLRAEQLERYKRMVQTFSSYCLHEPLDVDEEGRLPTSVPRSQLCPCSSLRTLNLAGNQLQAFEDVCGLLCYKSVTVLDLSQNDIKDGEALLLILERMPRLRSLKLSGNPLVRSLPRYRKTVLSRCSGLLHLDDRPVFDQERRLVNAWAGGGEDGESKEREVIKHEAEEAQKKRLEDFRALISQHTAQRGPQAAYVAAISTNEAIRNSNRASVEVGLRVRSVDPDDSPTSSEESDDEDMPAPVSTTVADNRIRRKDGDGSGQAPLNVQPGDTRCSQLPQRVLSCNRRVEPAAVAATNEATQEEEDSEIYIPS